MESSKALVVASKALTTPAQPKEVTKKPAPSICDPSLRTVTIMIGAGDKQKSFNTYKEFACYYSPVLDRAFNGNFAESQTQTITLDDFQYPWIFGYIQCWMYTQQVKILHLGATFSIPSQDLSKLWVLADRLLIPKLQNDIVKELVERTKSDQVLNMVGLDAVGAIWTWDNTAPGSKFRKLLVDKCAAELPLKNWAYLEKAPLEFIYEVSLALKGDNSVIRDRKNVKKLKVDDYLVVVPKN